MKHTVITFLTFVIIINGCNNQEANKASILPSNFIPLKVFSCNSDSLPLSLSTKNALIESGMTQCMMLFGVLLSADREYADILFGNGWKNISRDA